MNDQTPRNWHRLAGKMAYRLSCEQSTNLKAEIKAKHQSRLRRRNGILVTTSVLLLILMVIVFDQEVPEERAIDQWRGQPTVVASNNIVSPRRDGKKPSASIVNTTPAALDADFGLVSPRVVAIAAGTRFSVEEEISSSAVHLAHGSVEIVTGPETTKELTVHVGTLVIRDIGTIFTVETLPEQQVRVAVTEGKVMVTWPTGHADLKAGADGVFPSDAQRVFKSDSVALPAPAAESTVVTPAQQQADWRADARDGDHMKAARSILVHPEWVPDEPEDLLLAADIMRLTQHPRQASKYLVKAVQLLRNDARQAAAAFSLGKVYLNALDMPAAAARAFSIAAENRSPLAEESKAREVEAWYRADQYDNARQAAQQYFQQYPDGIRMNSVRTLFHEIK